MTPKLTDEQREAIEQHQGAPVFVEDPLRDLRYVLVPAEVYQRVRALFDAEPFDVKDTYPAQEQALGKAGWDDSKMDAYNNYDGHRPQP